MAGDRLSCRGNFLFEIGLSCPRDALSCIQQPNSIHSMPGIGEKLRHLTGWAAEELCTHGVDEGDRQYSRMATVHSLENEHACGDVADDLLVLLEAIRSARLPIWIWIEEQLLG